MITLSEFYNFPIVDRLEYTASKKYYIVTEEGFRGRSTLDNLPETFIVSKLTFSKWYEKGMPVLDTIFFKSYNTILDVELLVEFTLDSYVYGLLDKVRDMQDFFHESYVATYDEVIQLCDQKGILHLFL